MNADLFELRYMYRDGANYKFRGRVIISGTLSLEELNEHLLFGEYFIPEDVGLPDLSPSVRGDDDHDLHEFEEIVRAEEGNPLISADVLLARMKAANRAGWFRKKTNRWPKEERNRLALILRGLHHL